MACAYLKSIVEVVFSNTQEFINDAGTEAKPAIFPVLPDITKESSYK